jgi:hypothetical protein
MPAPPIMNFHKISKRAKNLPLAERSEGKCVAATFMAPGVGGGIPGEAAPHPSAINVAATPIWRPEYFLNPHYRPMACQYPPQADQSAVRQ